MSQRTYSASGFPVAALALAALALLSAGLIALATAQQAYAGTLVAAQGASGLTVGDTFTVDGNKYKVSKIDQDPGDLSEVILVKYGSKNKKPTINTVKYNGEKFEVDEIGKNAFNNKAGHKLKAITLGRNVDDIDAKAFYGCKKLKCIDMRKADVIEIEKEHGRYVVDEIDIGKKAFAKAGTACIKVKCGKGNASYRAQFKKVLVKRGMRDSVTVVK